MFDVGYSELLLIAIVTLLVVGPKELPNLLRQIGRWTGRARAMARHFRSGFDTMIREAEIEEMNKQWAAHNESIMNATPDLRHLPEAERDADLEDLADLPPTPVAKPEVTPPPLPIDAAKPAVAPPADADKPAGPPTAP
jgi:sec-independent protein translocase protein TatB